MKPEVEQVKNILKNLPEMDKAVILTDALFETILSFPEKQKEKALKFFEHTLNTIK